MTRVGEPRDDTWREELSALGPFFAIETHPHTGSPPPLWRPMSVLISEPDILAARVDQVRSALAQRVGRRPQHIDPRVAASVAHLGLAARLIAPMIGAISLGCPPLSWSPDQLWWHDQLSGAFPLSVARQLAAEESWPGATVEGLTNVLYERYRVSRIVLWGNIGSAANSAAQLIAAARPDVAAQAYRAADAVLSDSRVDEGTARAGREFRRRSCCQIWRVSNDRSATCGDCVLR